MEIHYQKYRIGPSRFCLEADIRFFFQLFNGQVRTHILVINWLSCSWKDGWHGQPTSSFELICCWKFSESIVQLCWRKKMSCQFFYWKADESFKEMLSHFQQSWICFIRWIIAWNVTQLIKWLILHTNF